MNRGELEPRKSQMIDQEMSEARTTRPSLEELYPQELGSQVERFISNLETANSLKPEHARRDEKNYTFLRDFYKRLFTERNARTYEVESNEYQEVKDLANSLFPVPTYWNLCMDGRVLSVLTNGASSGIGSSFRVPGAMHREFVRGDDGNIFLRENSNFANLLEAGLEKSPEGNVAEVFDSHIKCAAREAEENQTGKHPADHGLMADVLSKKEMALATEKFVKNKFGDNKKVITIQTSFNPSNGFMYMGLETEHALALARGFADGKADLQGKERDKVKPEYTDEVLQHLVNDLGVISTEILAKDSESIFENYSNFQMDWQHNYLESAQNLWSSIKKMHAEAMPKYRQAVKMIYPHADENETNERALLLLTNAYSGYLHNREPYPYDEHKEQFIKIYEGGQPPYDISAFVLNPHLKDLPANIELAASLVRKNRQEQRVKDASGSFVDPEEFREAVVPIVMQEIVRDNLPEEEWKKLSKIDWYDEKMPMPTNWDTMSDEDFFNFLNKKGEFSLSVARSINNQRKRMAMLYDPDLPTASRLIAQHKVVVPTISGQNRRNYFILPFTKLGFND